MRFTNFHNLPRQLVSAILADPYDSTGSDITVTSLIRPPRQTQLRVRHADKIVEDISDRVWAFLGQVAHKIIERADQTHVFSEQRIFITVNGWRVSGQSDCYTDHDWVWDEPGQGRLGTMKAVPIPPVIRDYKLIKVSAGRFSHDDWEAQLNCLAHLWRSHGFPVQGLEIVAIFRDWSKMLLSVESNYPPPAKIFPQKMWTPDQAEAYVNGRVLEHQLASQVPDELLPFCTPEDQWRRSNKYAVMTQGRKRAHRIFDDRNTAIDYGNTVLKGKHPYIEERAGGPIKCLQFCDVRPFCNQFAIENPDYKETSHGEDDN